MSILDRKPKHYSTSDLFWEPSAAPGSGVVGDVTPIRLTNNDVQFAQDVLFDTNGVVRNRGGFNGQTLLTGGATGQNYLAATTISSSLDTSTPTLFALAFNDATTGNLCVFASGATVATLSPTSATSLLVQPNITFAAAGRQSIVNSSTNLNPPIVDICNLYDNSGAIFCGGFAYNSLPGNSFINSPPQLWYGNLGTNATTAGTFTSVRGSTAVVGVGTAWTSALVGSFLWASTAILIGKVIAVTSTTTLTLEKGARRQAAGLIPGFYAMSPVRCDLYKGRITTSTSSQTVVGSGTKWLAEPSNVVTGTLLNGGYMFRYRDGAFVGQIGTPITNDTTLSLLANAAVAMTNEEYYIKTSMDQSTEFGQSAGVEYFANRYWMLGPAIVRINSSVTYPSSGYYVNSILFSKKNDPNCWDPDDVAGDIINLPQPKAMDQIRAGRSTRSGLLVFRANDTFILTGYSPETFVLRKILDDGCVSGFGIKRFGNGLIWSGYQGIYYFDGTKITNLLQGKVLTWYRKTVVLSDRDNASNSTYANKHRLGSAMIGSNYLVSLTNNGAAWPSGAAITIIGAVTMNINMDNGAISFFSNVRVANSVDISGTGSAAPIYPTAILTHPHPVTFGFAGTPKAVYGEPIYEDSTTTTRNYDNQVITDMTQSQIGPANGGPIPIIHSAGYALGDATRLKFWKMFLANYISAVPMTMAFYTQPADTSGWPPLDTGTVPTVGLPVGITSNILKRIKFLARSPIISFRIYQTAAPSAATSQRFKLFWWKVGGKQMRQGRVP